MNWNQRLSQARIAKGINKSELARQVGVSAATVTQWENATITSLAGNNLDRVCQVLGISPEYLLHGTTSRDAPEVRFPLMGAVPVQALEDEDPEFIPIRMVKLRLSAGIVGFRTEPEHEQDALLKMSRAWIARHGFSIESLIAIKVRGESMEPSLYDGDMVVVNTADTTPADGVVFAVNYEGEAVVKRMSRDAGDWWLTSDNDRRFPRKICRGNDCMMVGRVVWREGSRI